MFGLTTVILVLSGLRDMSYIKFALYSAISSLLWVAVFGFIGYHCADMALSAFYSLENHKFKVIAGLSVFGLTVWYWKHRQNLNHCVEAIKQED